MTVATYSNRSCHLHQHTAHAVHTVRTVHCHPAQLVGLALADTHPTCWVAQCNLGLDTLGGVVSDTCEGGGGGGIQVHSCNMVHVLELRGIVT